MTSLIPETTSQIREGYGHGAARRPGRPAPKIQTAHGTWLQHL